MKDKTVYYLFGMCILILQLSYLIAILNLDLFSYFVIMFLTLLYGLCFMKVMEAD
jgi:hypothetical protein